MPKPSGIYCIGSIHGNWVISSKVDSDHYSCVCKNCNRHSVVTRTCLRRNFLLKSKGCRSCNSGAPGISHRVIQEKGTLQCCKCKKILPEDAFHIKSNNTVTKRDSYCKCCKRELGLNQKYGITREKFDILFVLQKGKCAVCNQSSNSLVVDHDHVTNQIRGLLCSNCNLAIGLFKDNPEIVASAEAYLRKRSVPL